MCYKCSDELDLVSDTHNCDSCKNGYTYFAHKNGNINCYNIPCNQVNSNYRELGNTHECIFYYFL